MSNYSETKKKKKTRIDADYYVDESGKVSRVAYDDMTERKQREHDRKINSKLEKVMKESMEEDNYNWNVLGYRKEQTAEKVVDENGNVTWKTGSRYVYNPNPNPTGENLEKRQRMDEIKEQSWKDFQETEDYKEHKKQEELHTVGGFLKSVASNYADISLNIVEGGLESFEGMVDGAGYIVAGGLDLVGADGAAKKVRNIAGITVVDDALAPIYDVVDDYSTIGDTTKSIAQGVGQVGATILTSGAAGYAGLSYKGASAVALGGNALSSFGRGTDEAYKGGAEPGEAELFGLINSAADTATEVLFAGMGKGANVFGYNKALLSLDDALAKKITRKLNSTLAKNLVQYTIKSGAEGLEEVLAGFIQAWGKSVTYMSEEEFSKILEDEDLLEQFIVGSLTSAIVQSKDVVGATTEGKDFITGYDKNTQAVIQKETENRIAEQEKDGTKLTNKEKAAIEAQVEADLKNGGISTDVIESVVGGETYTQYQEVRNKELEVLRELSNLYKGEELDAEIAKFLETSETVALRNRLSQESFDRVKGSYLAESYYDKSRRRQRFTADLSKYDDAQRAVVQKAIDSGVLNNTNRTHEFVDLVAKISADKGVLFDFTNNERLKNSSFAVEGKTVNGFVDENGNVVLNANASKSLNTVVGHEITHVLEGTDLYAELQTAMDEYAKGKKSKSGKFENEYMERLYNARQLYKNVKGYEGVKGFDKIRKEVTADLVGDYLFTDPKFISHLSTKHRNLAQRIYDEIKYMLKLATAGSKEARDLERIKKMFDEVYRSDVKQTVKSEFNVSEVVEETKDLIASHNITEQLLTEALDRGSLVMPSLAVTNKEFTEFGEISLLFDKRSIDPEADPGNKMYGADAWTPTQTQLKKNAQFDTEATERTISDIRESLGEYASDLFPVTAEQFRNRISESDGSIYDAYAHNIGMQTAYAMQNGIITEIPTNKNGTVDKMLLDEQLSAVLDTDNGWRQYKKWLNGISDRVISSYDQASSADILNNMKAQPASAKTFKLSEDGSLVVPASEYSSIDEVRSNKGRLSENAAAEAKAVGNEFLEFAKKIDGDTKKVINAINTAFADRYSIADIVKTFNQQGINISTEIATELQGLYKKAVELPTEYFEAKPHREVGFDEVAAFVVPNNIDASLKQRLLDKGYNVVEYDPNVDGDRKRVVNSFDSLKFSLSPVAEVQPSSDLWSRTHTTAEAKAVFPDMWNVAAEDSNVRNPTQITSTVKSYRKIYDFLQSEGFNGTILDASSGLGYGTKAGIEEYGFDVEDIEPYPDKGYNPKYTDYSSLDKTYDAIISNAVLNVLPQDQRDALVVKMGEMLNDGGRMFINVRGKDVESLAKTGKNIHLGDMEWIETVKGSYQKGFTKNELVAYLQDALGDGYTVEKTNMFGAVSAIVTKNGAVGEAKYSLTEPFDDSNGTHFDNAVLLDTDFFDGISPRNWGTKLRELVYERASEDPFILPIVDEKGNTTMLQFASPKDRAKKNGGSEHRVLDELTTTSDNISKLAVVHIDEIVSVSDENSPYFTTGNEHGWLDKNGWLHRNANVINRKNGNIYNLTFDIAKAEDGRTVLYATDGKIKKVGSVKVNSLKIKGSRQNSNFDGTVAQEGAKVKQYSLSEDTDIDPSNFYEVQSEVNRLTESIRDFEASAEWKAMMDKISEGIANDNADQVIKEYNQFVEESGYLALKEKRDSLRESLENARKKAEEDRVSEAVEQERSAIEKSGLSEADYFRKQAVKEFGYTPYFYDAGYIVTNGKMLNFSGEKGQHFGSRGQDHRAIETIYADTERSDALNRFVNEGNIRIVPESPGIDVSSTVEPTKEQYATIKKFLYQYADQEYFSIDISGPDGRVVGSLVYENRIYPAKVIGDLKHYYETGEIREQSSLGNFVYSLSAETDKSYLDAVNRGDTETAQEMVLEVAEDAGWAIRAYHGTSRGDRVGNVFLPERATSGPMSFFTSDRTVAEGYAKSKRDTSMAYDPDFASYETQFRIKTKSQDIPLHRAWGYLPFDARRRITEKAGQLRENWDGDNELILDTETNEANGGFQWQLKEARGNAITALTEQWLNSGTLFNEESRFLDVLEMAGVTEEVKKIGMDAPYFKDPNERHEKVYDTVLKITKPFDTATVDEQFVADLESWYEEQDQTKYVRENMESDLWDKNGIDAYEFADRLRRDIENGTAHAWTSIPDSVTDYLKSKGYDGIKDTGGKFWDGDHIVWIPFYSEQIKSAEPVTYDDKGNVIPLSERFNPEKKDIRYSLSNEGDAHPVYGSYNIYGKDVAYEDEFAPVRETQAAEQPVAETVDQLVAPEETAVETAETEQNVPIAENVPQTAEEMFPDENVPETESEYQERMDSLAEMDAPMERPVYDDGGQVDVIPITKKLAADIRREVRSSLGLSNKQMADVRAIIDKYTNSEFPSREQLFTELKDKFGTYTESHADESVQDAKKYLRTTGVYVDDYIKHDIADYADFMRRNRGKIRFSNHGIAVDVMYQELHSLYPHLFPESIIVPADQFQQMVDVANMDSVTKYDIPLDDDAIYNVADMIMRRVGEYRQSQKLIQANRYSRDSFEGLMQDADSYVPPVDLNKILANRRNPIGTTAPVASETVNSDMYNGVVKGQETYITTEDKLNSRRNPIGTETPVAPETEIYDAEHKKGLVEGQQAMWQEPTDLEKAISRIDRILESDKAALAYEFEMKKKSVKDADALRKLEAVYRKKVDQLEYEANVKKKSAETANQRKVKDVERKAVVEDLVGDTTFWRDKKLGLSYQVNTLRRNLRDVVRDANGNRDIAKADAIYDWLQGSYNRNEATLKRESSRIKSQYFAEKITSAEDVYIQMLGEFRHNPDTTLTEDVVKEFYEKHKKQIDPVKVDRVITYARMTYDNLLLRVNEVLREQGMREIPYRQGYFPHFTNPKQGWLAKLLNWKTVDTEIPTDIAGLTEEFNPNRSWQSFNKERTSDTTDYSFLKGMDTYVHGALDWIYHIDDIQNRRAFENHLRYIHSEKGIQEQIDKIRSSDELDADEMQDQIDLVLAQAANPLNNFVTNLRAGTNTLANKKSAKDRAMEEDTNRKAYSVMTNLNNRINANMVVGSFSAALTNVIPITQSWVEVNPWYSVRALGDVVRSAIRDDGMVNKSDFLTNRLNNEENLHQTTWDKVSDKAAFVMEVIDSISSQTVWRSKYLQNLKNGMSENDAIKNADQFAENVLAGRSRGNQPTIFDAKNPLTKIFTAFQLEVNNQYGYMFKDAPQDTSTKKRLIGGFAKAFLGAYLYNAVYSSLVGRDAAFDPIGIIEDLIGDIGGGEEEPEDIFLNFTDNLIEEMPFVGGLFGGGRVPISSAIPYDGDYKGLITDIANGEVKTKELLKPLYYLAMPVGGGQLKKTVEGLSMFDDDHPIAGSYTDSGDLRFPVDDSFGSKLKAALFGQYSSENAREYFDNEWAPLDKKRIQEYLDVEMPYSDYQEYREGLKGKTKIGEKADYISGLDLPIDKKNLLINNQTDRKDPIDLTDYDQYPTWEDFDLAQTNPKKYSFLQENGISAADYEAFDEDTKSAYNWAYQNPEKYTLSKAVSSDIVTYKQFTKALSSIEADPDENGKSISGSRKKKVINYINGLDATYEEKIVLLKSEYPSDDTYNHEIIQYIESRTDFDFDDKRTVLEELGFTVYDDGRVTWD